jgi:hypothetical protein
MQRRDPFFNSTLEAAREIRYGRDPLPVRNHVGMSPLTHAALLDDVDRLALFVGRNLGIVGHHQDDEGQTILGAACYAGRPGSFAFGEFATRLALGHEGLQQAHAELLLEKLEKGRAKSKVRKGTSYDIVKERLFLTTNERVRSIWQFFANHALRKTGGLVIRWLQTLQPNFRVSPLPESTVEAAIERRDASALAAFLADCTLPTERRSDIYSLVCLLDPPWSIGTLLSIVANEPLWRRLVSEPPTSDDDQNSVEHQIRVGALFRTLDGADVQDLEALARMAVDVGTSEK